MTNRQIQSARHSIRMMFLFAGVAISTWSPMIPFVKLRLQLSDLDLGRMILLMGCGTLVMNPLSALLVNRFGARVIMVIAAACFTALLPLLAVVSHPWLLGACLFVVGASMGAGSVARNSQAVLVERAIQRPIMSSFHAFFSLGCLAGSLLMTSLQRHGWSLLSSVSAMAALAGLITITSFSGLLPRSEDRELPGTKFMRPGRSLLVLGGLCLISFLSEGAVVDWGASYLRFIRDVVPENAGMGFAAFSIAMAAGRLTGDFVTLRLGRERIVLFGGLIAAAGYLTVIVVPFAPLSLAGFIMIGAGLSNIVPIVMSAAGRVPEVPPAVSIATVSTIAGVGLLLVPAVIGRVANAFGLSVAFAGLAVLLLILAAGHRAVR